MPNIWRAAATGADLALAAIATGGVAAAGDTRRFLRIGNSFPPPDRLDPFDRTWPVAPAAAN